MRSEDLDLLYGGRCPACGGPLEPGTIRYVSPDLIQHKNPDGHPQAGHHELDVEAALAASTNATSARDVLANGGGDGDD